MALITLLTDFGIQDEYVGVMKAVILSINPGATIVDITHHIEPQDITQAAYTLKAAHSYFPKGSVHVVVVDPGVGGARSILALRKNGCIFLAPDNGVLTFLIQNNAADEIFLVENRAYFLKSISNTFHGRDIFAPVAAHLSTGTALSKVGPEADPQTLIQTPFPQPYINPMHDLVGAIVAIDHFGNLITNIDTTALRQFRRSQDDLDLEIVIGNHIIKGLNPSYANTPPRAALAIINSRDQLEIALNGANAAEYLKARKGDPVTLRIRSQGDVS